MTLDELVEEGVAAYRQLCIDQRADIEHELVEARLAHGHPTHVWAALRLTNAHHQIEHPGARLDPTRPARWEKIALAWIDDAPHVAALWAHTRRDLRVKYAQRARNHDLLAALAGTDAVAAVTTNRHTPARVLDQIARHLDTLEPDTAVGLFVAQHPNTSAATLEQLWGTTTAVTMAIVGHRHTKPELRARALDAPDWWIRAALARTRRYPHFATLAADPDENVRAAVARNLTCPPAILQQLTGDRSALVAGEAASTLATIATRTRDRALARTRRRAA